VSARRPNFGAIYFDTNVLLEAHWPEPAPVLNNLLLLSGWWQIERCIPEPVLSEVECNWRRKVHAGIDSLRTAQRTLAKAASPIACDVSATHTPATQLEAQFIVATADAIAHFGVTRVPFTRRSIEEVFAYAAQYVRPFAAKGEGKGFKDAVILLSILDHLRDRPDTNGVLVTNDSDFKEVDYRVFESTFSPDRLRVMNADEAFKDVFEPYFDETRVKPYRELMQTANTMVRARADELRAFVAAHLTADMLRRGPFDSVRQILSLDRLDVMSVDLPFPERDLAELEINIEIRVAAQCNALVLTDYRGLRALFGGVTNLGAESSKEEERILSWFGVVRASGTVVGGQLRNIAFQGLTTSER
jgi:predicted nucleic acid-binding protein